MPRRIRADLGIVRPADIPPEPWANGLGVTRVLAARPSWRISLAEIEGRMPFSPFPGADRVLIPLSAGGVTLDIGGDERWVPPYSGFSFRGEERVVAETGTERVSVVNVMTRRSSGRMDWRIRRVTGAIPPEAEAAVVLGGRVTAGAELLTPGTVFSPAGNRGVAASDAVVALLGLAKARRRRIAETFPADL